MVIQEEELQEKSILIVSELLLCALLSLNQREAPKKLALK